MLLEPELDWRSVIGAFLYNNGSEELYDLNKDPNEYKNLAGDKRFSNIIVELGNNMPVYNEIDYFVSRGFWKAVIHKDRSKTELFNFQDNKAVPEEKNVYHEHPEIVNKMLAYIAENNITQKYLSIPE